MVVTGSHGRAQIRFRDGALISLQPESRFRIDQYAYGEAKQRGFYSLLEGTLRAISGAIGKKNPDDFRLDTPTATIAGRLIMASGDVRIVPQQHAYAEGLARHHLSGIRDQLHLQRAHALRAGLPVQGRVGLGIAMYKNAAWVSVT